MEIEYVIKVDISGRILENVETDPVEAAKQVAFYREHIGKREVSVERRTITTEPLNPMSFIEDYV